MGLHNELFVDIDVRQGLLAAKLGSLTAHVWRCDELKQVPQTFRFCLPQHAHLVTFEDHGLEIDETFITAVGLYHDELNRHRAGIELGVINARLENIEHE